LLAHPRSVAALTEPVEKYLMLLHAISTGNKPVDFVCASAEVEDFVAFPAPEVMMMLFTGQLIAGGLVHQLDLREKAVFDELLDVSIDRREVDPFHLRGSKIERFLRTQRAIGRFEGVPQCSLLLRVPCLSHRPAKIMEDGY